MKTVQECLVLGILFCVVYSFPDLRCPYPSERGYRSRWFCNGMSTEKYACLYNSIQKKLEESCKFEPKISVEGKEYRISVFPDPVSCQNPQRYQPFPLRSNISSECVLLKSTCSDDGQYLFYHGSSTNDHRCGCDFPKGFGFVHEKARQCDCNPSKEDCSCYMKKTTCLDGYKLSSDYTCIHEDNKTHVSKCPGIGPDRTGNDTQPFRLHPKNETDDDGARIFKIIATIFAVFCIIYVICVFVFLLTNKIPKCLIQEISPPFNLIACQEGCFLKLAWSKKSEKSPTNRIQEFKIYYTHNDNWDDHQHEMVAADILHFYFSKLFPSKTYRFKVAACLNNSVESKCSEEVTFVTGLPIEPQYFHAYKHKVEDNGNSCSVLLKWAAPGNTLIDINNYFIRFTTNNWETCEEKLLPCDVYEYVIQNAQKHVHYLFQIVSMSNKVCSIPLNQIYSTKHDTYQSGAEFDVKAYMDVSMESFKAEVHKLFQDIFNDKPGVQNLQGMLLGKGSIILELTFTSDGFDDEKVLHDTLENAFKAGVIGPWQINLKKFWFKRLHNPLPPQQVTALSINDGVVVSWTEPPSTLFNTKEYILEFSRNNWTFKEKKNVPADKNKFFIPNVLPLTTLYAKVYTCICHSIRSSPSAEVITVVEGPSPPENVKVVGIEDSIEITWTKPLHPVLDFVKHYKIVIDEGDNTICETVGKDRLSFLKRYCKPFTTYKFRIVTCTVNGLESQQSPVVPIQTNGFTKTENENFQRLSELLSNVAYRIIKERFDNEYPSSDLPKLLQQNEQTLEAHLSEDQMKQILSKAKTGRFEDAEFDLHLMLALLLCLKGWTATKRRQNILPSKDDTSEKSDFNRIVICSTRLQNMKENKIPSEEFENLWDTVSPAIIRLGGEKYKSWCENMKTTQTLKQENEETRTFDEIIQSTTTEIQRLKREKENIHREVEQVKEHQIKHKEKLDFVKQSQTTLQADVDKIKKDVASLSVCAVDSHQLQIDRWKKDNKRFQEIKVVNDIVAGITNDFNCITITGIPGIGKTATLHHIALYLSEVNNYTIVPCFNPNEIIQYYKKDSFQVFVLDDICGRYSLNVTKVDTLLDGEECIKDILKEGKSKVMSTCRLQILQELELKQLDFVIGKVFDMSNEYPLTVKEKFQIAHEYLADEVIGRIEENIGTYSCFPLKCKLFEERQQDNPKTFFQNHFDVYTDELDKLEKLADKSKYCAIFLSVVFDGCIESKEFIEEASDDLNFHTDTRVKRILAKFRVDDVSKIETKLESLLNVYLKKMDNKFVVIHDTMLDFLCSYFGQKSQKELIQFADIKVLQERTIFKSLSQSKLIETDDFTIVIAEENMVLYFNRLINEIKNGKIQEVFYNRQMQFQEFRKLMIQAMTKRDESFLRQLIVTKDHDKLSQMHGIDMHTPLTLASYLGYEDLVMFMLRYIDKQDQELFNAIQMACFAGHANLLQLFVKKVGTMKLIGKEPNDFKLLEVACKKGHTNIVQMLLQVGFNVNSTNADGETLLMFACYNEHTEIINQLINYKTDINKRDKNGVTALMIACNKENLPIVKTLLKEGANVNLYDKLYTTPLMVSCQKGNFDIVDVLLKADADVNKTGQNALSVFECLMSRFVDSLVDFGNVDISDKDDGWTALHFAAMNGNKRIIEALIKYGAKVDLVNALGLSPLRITIITGNIDNATFLINENADINIQDRLGRTCLMTACDIQNINMVKLFLRKKADIEKRDILGRTALQIACTLGNGPLIQELIKAGACINTRDIAGDTCINISASKGNAEILQILIEGGGNIHEPDNKGWTPLKTACQDGNESAVTFLLEHGALVDQADHEGWTPLMSACKMGHVRIAQHLISKTAKIEHFSAQGYTPLMIASKTNQVEIMKLLIASGARIDNQNDRGVTALGLASCIENTDALQCLLSNGADVNKRDLKGFSPLKIASSAGHENSVKIMINKGADLDITDKQGWTPLKSACKQGHIAVAAILIDNNANINKHDDEGWTPLKIASLRGHTEIVKILLSNEAKIEQADNAGWTPLMSACQGGHREIVLMLIAKGANINHCSSDGHTPVVVACKNADTDILQILISSGANIQTVDNKGLTPLRIACDQRQASKVKLLINSGADVNHVDVNNVSPLNASCKYGEYNIVESLVKANANIHLADNQGCTPLLRACEFGQLKIVQFLVQMGSNIQHANAIGWTPLLVAVREKYDGIIKFLESQGATFGKEDLLVACKNGHIQIVKLLIEKGFDKNTIGSAGLCPLVLALKNQHFDVADYLLQLRAEVKSMDEIWSSLIGTVHTDGSTLLTKACATGYKQIVQLIMQHTKGISQTDQNGWAPLTIACYSGHQAIVKLLVESGIQLNEPDDNKKTPFLVALDKNHVNIIEYLISVGLDVNIINGFDDRGYTPLMNACRMNQLTMIDLLISRGADVNKVGLNNKSALEIACEEEHWQCVDLLLKKGTNFIGYERILNGLKSKLEILQLTCENGFKDLFLVLLKDFDKDMILKNGDSLLTHACKHGQLAIVQLLCREGANIDKQDDHYKTPLELACSGEYIDVVNYLIRRGARVDLPSNKGRTPLMTACFTGKLLIVKTLMGKGTNKYKFEINDSSISSACSGRQYEVIDFLIDSGIDVKLFEHYFRDLIKQHCEEGLDLLAISCKKGLESLTNFLISNTQYANKMKNESLKYIMYACSCGHESIVSLFISRGVDFNQVDDNGLTPLQLACKNGHSNIVESIIRMKVDINKADVKGLTPLHFACIVGKEHVVLSLIQAKAIINSKDKNGVTPLKLACAFGHKQIVEILVRNGADTNICDFEKWTPLMTSCQKGHKEISEFLIQNQANVNSRAQDGTTALMIACKEGNTTIAEILIDNGAHVDVPDGKGWTPLKVACKRERESIVALLLKKGANVYKCDKETWTPLMSVCQTNNLNILQLLLDHDIDVNNTTADGKTPLRIACEAGHLEMARALIKNGAEIMKSDKSELSPLHAVCAPNLYKMINELQDATLTLVTGSRPVTAKPLDIHLRVAEMLIECGADTNQATSEGTTPLMLACMSGESEMISMLIDKGAKANKADTKGTTPLSIASKQSNVDAVKLLLANGAFPDTEDTDGDTPLHFACLGQQIHDSQNQTEIKSKLFYSDNCLEIIKLLIEKGANINHLNKFGLTPLMLACMNDNLNGIEVLIENGADISKKDINGRTALFFACLNDNSNLMQYLVANGAKVNDVDKFGISPLKYLCDNIMESQALFELHTKFQNSLSKLLEPSTTANNTLENDFEKELKNKILLLVEHGADVNRADVEGWTPLISACNQKQYEIVKLLLEKGSHVDDAANNGITALTIACILGSEDLVSLLIEKANINKCCKEGYVPLHHACIEGHESIVKMLLQRNANVNHFNKVGWTPLMFACKTGYRDIVKLLLEHGANATWYSNDRWYPLKLAKKGKSKSIESLLYEYGAYMSEEDD